jgi:hypothetical protein
MELQLPFDDSDEQVCVPWNGAKPRLVQDALASDGLNDGHQSFPRRSGLPSILVPIPASSRVIGAGTFGIEPRFL